MFVRDRQTVGTLIRWGIKVPPSVETASSPNELKDEDTFVASGHSSNTVGMKCDVSLEQP